jgi:hypothetical protein
MSDTPNRRRPFLVTLLALLFLILSVLGWVRLEQAIQGWRVLSHFGGAGLPIYQGISGALWGLIGLPAVWGLWRRKIWTIKAVWPAALAYPLFFWLDRFLAGRAPQSQENWIFASVMTLVWGLLVGFTLSRRNIRPYFRRDQAS